MTMETVQKYKVSLEFDGAFKRLANFQKKVKTFNAANEASLKRQLALQKQLSKPKTAPTGRGGGKGVDLSESKLRMEQVKADQRRLKALERAKQALKSHNIMLGVAKDKQEQLTRATIKRRVETAKTAQEVRHIVKEEVKNLAILRKETKERKKQHFLMQRMKQSSQQIAGNMVSAFAIAAGVTGVTKIGQDFESVNNTLLTVTGSSEKAAESFQFVRDEAYRLGAGLTNTAKDYSKLVAAAKGQIDQKDTRELLTGMLEVSTVLGLSADDTAGSIRALQQMLGKTKVSAEELNYRFAA